MIITKNILKWVSCCNEAWNICFSKNTDNRFEFDGIENAYLNLVVLHPLHLKKEQLTDFLFAKYEDNLKENRTVCRIQKAGNIYCRSKKVSINKNLFYKVKSIDTIGELSNGEPYAEIMISQNEFFLEILNDSSIDFIICQECSEV